MNEITLKKLPGETEKQFVFRLASARDDGLLDMTWEDLAAIFNEELGKNQCSSAYRKPYQNAQQYRAEVFSAEDDAKVLQEIREAKQELYKERVRLRDEKNEFNKKLREDARKESFFDKLMTVMVDVDPIVVKPCTVTAQADVELVACLSDLHAGLVACNNKNAYSEDVLHDRLQQYANELGRIQERHHARKLILALMGDQISGSIHASLIAANSQNTVRQLKLACKEIAFFVQALTPLFPKIEIYSVSGNHSRINAKKEDNLPGDNMDSLIPFYLDAKFSGSDRVIVDLEEPYYGEYVRDFVCCGWRFVMVHGDLDTPDKAVYNVTQITGHVPDCILMGHRHNSAMLTEGKTRVIQTGCICGTDDYAFNKRLFAPPEQTVAVVSDRKPVECLYNIEFA